MSAALLAELRKSFTTPMWWLLAIVMFAYLAFIGAVMGFSVTASAENGGVALPGPDAAESVYSTINAVGYVFPLVIGSLAMTGEFRHKTVTASLLAEPSRGTFLLAKLVAMIPVGLLYGVIGTAGLLAGAVPLLSWRGDGAYLTDGGVLTVIGLGILVTAIWTIFGVAVGSVLTNQVVAIVAILAITQFVEPIARLGVAAVDALSGLSAYFPAAAADALIGSSLFSGMGGGPVDLLPRWGGALVLLGYVVVLCVIGWFTALRRDVG